MKEYLVIIAYYESGIKNEVKFYKTVESFDELKQAFLKRFGNIVNVPNKALKEKPLVKMFTHEANSIDEWVSNVNNSERWKLEVQ